MQKDFTTNDEWIWDVNVLWNKVLCGSSNQSIKAWNLYHIIQVCKRDTENIWNGGFQTFQYTYGDWTQAFKEWWNTWSELDPIQSHDWQTSICSA